MSDVVAYPERDWLAVDWAKSNAELARELGVVRGTVHCQRKRYAPDTVPGRKQISAAERAAALAARAAALTPPLAAPQRIAAVQTHHTPGRSEILCVGEGARAHWAHDPRAPRQVPRGVDALDGLHFAVGPHLTTARDVLDALGDDEDWAIGIADRLAFPWSRDFGSFLDALGELGLLEQRVVFHPGVLGGVFVRAYRRRVGASGESGGAG